jgi:DNA polymerase-3 subunit alpha (Gram-positive type)
MKIIVWDTETTGLPLPSSAPLEKQPRIIELGVVVVVGGKVESTHNWLINPEQQISDEITKITGIKNEDLFGKPTFGQLLGEIEEVFGHSDFGIAHNAPFDTTMLNNELKRLGRTGFPMPEMICSVQEYTHKLGKRYNLKNLYERVMGRKLEQTHRASDDAYALYEVLAQDKFFDQLES